MISLVQLTIGAHGGLERWRRFEHVSAHLRNDGVLWTLKRQQNVLDDVNAGRAPSRLGATSRVAEGGCAVWLHSMTSSSTSTPYFTPASSRRWVDAVCRS